MHRSFELWMRRRYGFRFNLERDAHGYYASGVVKRMFEVWQYCHGIDNA
nr:hypothetical protein [Escherichia coli]